MVKKLKDLPVGAKVYSPESKFLGETVVFRVAHKKKDRVKLITDGIVALRAFDAMEPKNSNNDRRGFGNNRWLHSNIRQYLNTQGTYRFVPQHEFDAPPIKENLGDGHNPYEGTPGFLAGFEKEFIDAILPAENLTAVPLVDGGGAEVVTDKVYLPSIAEIGLKNDTGVDEGEKWDLFTDDASRVARATKSAAEDSTYSISAGSAQRYWTRTHYPGSALHVRSVSSGGSHNYNSARIGYTGLRPALNLSPDISVSDKPNAAGVYVLEFNQPPVITLNTPQSQVVFENDNISIDGEAFVEDKGDVVIVKAKIADSRVINLATKVSDGKPFDFARTFLFKQGRVWQGNEPITSALSDTSHKIEVWAEDDKGGKSKVETRTFSTTANRPPTVKITKTPSLTNVTNSTPVEVAGTISDPDGHDVTMTAKLNDNPQVEIAIAGGEWSYIIQPSDLKEGVNEITIIGRDEYGMSHTKTVRISNTVYKADMSHVPSVALFDIPLEGVESDGAVMWLRRQSDNTQLEARVATAGKKEEDFHAMQKTSHVVGNTPRDQFAGQTGVKANNVTIEVTSTGNHSLLMIQGVVK